MARRDERVRAETTLSITFAIALYFVIWWTVLFAVLPFGLRTQHEEGSVTLGTPRSAPERPRLLRIALITSVVSAVILALAYATVAAGVVDLRGEPPPPPGGASPGP